LVPCVPKYELSISICKTVTFRLSLEGSGSFYADKCDFVVAQVLHSDKLRVGSD
jgi:hypothetical protein